MKIDSADVVVYSLRQKQRQERLEMILQAAVRQVYAEKGYRDTSMDEIAARVGIATATIYAHFASNMEALMVAAILERSFQRIVRDVKRDLCWRRKCHWEAHSHLSSRAKRFFSTAPCRFLLLWVISPRHSMQLQTLQKRYARDSSCFHWQLAQVVEQGKADRTNFDPCKRRATTPG